MKNQAILPLGEKLRYIRAHKGLSLDNVAADIGRDVSFVSRIERGQNECSPDTLLVMKKSLGVENAPLLEHEREAFKGRLYFWQELIRNRRLDEAKIVQDEFAVILDMPFEKGLISLYHMIRARYLMTGRDFEAAEAILNIYEGRLSQMDDESKYLYYHNKGSMGFYESDFKKALGFYLQAFEILIEDPALPRDTGLLFNIATCYSRLCLPFRAIKFAEMAYEGYVDGHTKTFGMQLDNLLGGNYSSIGEIKIARQLLEKALRKARSTNSDFYIGMVLHNLGYVEEREGNFAEAKEFYHQALPHYCEYKDMYLGTHGSVVRCLIKEGRLRQARLMLEEVTAQNNYTTEQSILFTSLMHATTLGDNASTHYIENTTIPHLLGENSYFRALFYCELLEEHYKKKCVVKKLLNIMEISRDIHKHIIFGRGD